MRNLRKANDRGRAEHGWLSSRHTFSFADYYDPRFMGFGPLRVINDDRVLGGRGFGQHPHRDMEIISYVVEGALEHRDSLGNGSVIAPGDVQVMRAGTGILHSEYNHSKTDPVRFLQIWVIPNQRGLTPGYEQRFFGEERRNRLALVASAQGRDHSLPIAQDVDLYASLLEPGLSLVHPVESGRAVWLQVASGQLRVGDLVLGEGDGFSSDEVGDLSFEAVTFTNFLLFNMQSPNEKGGLSH